MKQLTIRTMLLACIVTALTACGLSPQQLYPEPRISGMMDAIASGQTVSVAMSDQRSSAVIGTRGGLYAETNTLTVEAETVFPRLQAEAEAALRMRGFIPVPQGQAHSQFRLSIADLQYRVNEDRTFAGKAYLTAVLAVEAENSGRVYRGHYTANLEKGFVTALTDAANNELISQVMSDALARVFDDTELLQFMTQ